MSKKSNLNFTSLEKLPTPAEILQEFPASFQQRSFIEQTRQQIIQSLDAGDPRLLLIVGPCSIHDVQAAKEYALRLRELAKYVSDSFLVIMRVYFEKARTTLGWKGLLYDPHLDGTYDISAGIRKTRKLLLDLADLNMPAAAEFLDPISCYYFSDLVSWGCIGARTSESQIHRQMASGLPMPLAFKNNTTGNVEVAVNGIVAASVPHAFFGLNDQGQVSLVRTQGNPHCHIALRGGKNKPNYDPQSISNVLHHLRRSQLPLRLIVDCSHDNSNRNHEKQSMVIQSVMHQILEGERCIRGMILESNINAGNQPISLCPSLLRYAVSLTDPCLDWESTEHLILWAYEMLKKEKISQIPSLLCQR